MPRRTRITMPDIPLTPQQAQYHALGPDADACQAAYRKLFRNKLDPR